MSTTFDQRTDFTSAATHCSDLLEKLQTAAVKAYLVTTCVSSKLCDTDVLMKAVEEFSEIAVKVAADVQGLNRLLCQLITAVQDDDSDGSDV